MSKLLCILLLFAAALTRAQEDSLRKRLQSYRETDTVKVRTMILLGEHLHHKSRHREAIAYYEEAIRLSDSLHFPDGAGDCYNQLSVIQKELGNYAKALELVMTARKIARKSGNLRLDVSAAINCANIYFLKGDPKETMRIQREALTLALSDTSPKLRQSVATCQGNLATCFHIAGQFDSASVYYQKALAYYLKHGPKSQLAAQYTNIGALYWDQKQYPQALDYLEKAAALLRQAGDKVNVVAAIMNMGEIYLDLQQPEKAMPLLYEAQRIAYESQSRDRIMQSHFVLAEAFRRSGDFKQAVAYFERYSAMKDSLLNESNNKHIAEMQTRFDTEKKEQEIQLLQKDRNIRELVLSEQEANIHRQRLVIYSVAGGLLLLVALVVFIWRSYRQKKRINAGLEIKNREINQQKELIGEKNTLITDSIDYARNIQQAILPGEESIRNSLGESFVLFMPKDIVSGDFYWMKPLGDGRVLFATVDCTGHGVPGAFMSVMAFNMLENICAGKTITQPARILDALNRAVLETLRQDNETATAKYGMDISLVCLDKKQMQVEFAGAHNPLLVVCAHAAEAAGPAGATRAAATDTATLLEIKADKTTMGLAKDNFTHHTMAVQPGDTLYLFTDGYADQKGGPDNKKLFAPDFRNILLAASGRPVGQQKEFLLQAFHQWKGGNEQIDDVLVVGLRV